MVACDNAELADICLALTRFKYKSNKKYQILMLALR